jgi:hypothetical protein
MVQNIATLRAMAAIDPDKYNPLFQQAMVQYTQLNNQGQQIKETGRHNVANEGIAQQQVGIARDKLVQDGRQHDDLMDFRYYQDDGVNQRAQAQIGLYERGLRGGAGRGAGAGDPYKQTREARQAQAAFIKNNPSLYSFTPEGTDKPVTHAGMLTLTNNLYQTTDEATTQQVLMGIQAQAQQAAVDPQTGRMDYAKYRAALDKGTADVMNHLAQKKAGTGAAPNGTPDVEARNPTNVPNLREQAAASMQKEAPKGTGMPKRPDAPREQVKISRDGKSVSAPGVPAKQEQKPSPVSPEGLRARMNAPLTKDDIDNLKYMR